MDRETARQLLQEHGVPANVMTVWDEEMFGSPLRNLYGQPDFHLAESLPGYIPGLSELIPLFDDNGDSIIGYLPSKNQFVQVYFEELPRGEAGLKILGHGWVQFAASILIGLAEADLEEFDSVAAILEFPDPGSLKRLLFGPDCNFERVVQYFEGLATTP